MRRLWWGTAGVTLAYAAVLGAGDLDHHRALMAAVILPFWASCLCLIRWSTMGSWRLRRPAATIALAAAIVQLPGLFAPPRDSSDAYRYVWDGRVQLSGTSPYRFVPLDDALAGLRDRVLFPALGSLEHSGVRTEPVPTSRDALLVRARNDPRTVINRPAVPTAYPPVAEAWFTAVAAVTPWGAGTLGLQVGSAFLAIAVAAALAGWLSRQGRDPREALWWAWCPTVVITAGNSAHVDVLAAALALSAMLIAQRSATPSRLAAAGVLVGVAGGVKLFPLVLLPALMPLRRHGFRRILIAPAAALATLAAAYLPHVLSAGWLVQGYLPGYLLEESGPNRAAVLRLLMPGSAVPYALVVALVGATFWAGRRAVAGDPAGGATILFGVLILGTTPSYPWYAVPLVALAVVSRRLEWLAVALAGWVAYCGVRVPPVSGLAFAASAGVVAVLWWRRRTSESRLHQPPGSAQVATEGAESHPRGAVLLFIADSEAPAGGTTEAEVAMLMGEPRREGLAGWCCVARRVGVARRLLAASAILAAGLVLTGCVGTSKPQLGAVGVAASTGKVSLFANLGSLPVTVEGRTFDATRLTGKPVVLWWCSICRAEAPTVARIAAEFSSRVQFVGVAGQGTVTAMNDLVRQTGTGTLTHLADVKGTIWRDYGVSVQPAFALITVDGRADAWGAWTRDLARANSLAVRSVTGYRRSHRHRPGDTPKWLPHASIRSSHALLPRVPGVPARPTRPGKSQHRLATHLGYRCQRQRPSPRKERASDLLQRGSGGRI